MPLPFTCLVNGAVAHTGAPETIIDYPSYVSVMEMAGTQSSGFGVSPVTTYNATIGGGILDDGPAINGAIAQIVAGNYGQSLYFPAGTYLVNTALVNASNVPFILAAGATFTGTYATSFTPIAGPAVALKGASVAGFARGVITAITTSTTYTGTTTNTLTFGSNATLPTQDGITAAVGDVFILPGGTISSCAITACDTGPWQISSLGAAGAKVVLVRPSWYQTGQNIPVMYQINVGPEGTQYADTKWTSWANTPGTATASIIPVGKTATDPLFYPDHVAFNGTLVSGFFTTTTIPIRSLTQTSFAYQPTNYSGGTTTAKFIMGAISSGGAATAVGYVGTGSVSITACAVAGTVVSGDVSTGILHVWNRA